MSDDLDMQIRRLNFRLKRQGMLEVEAWLAPLLDVDLQDFRVRQAVEQLLRHELPEIQAMMTGDMHVPELLHPWLGRAVR